MMMRTFVIYIFANYICIYMKLRLDLLHVNFYMEFKSPGVQIFSRAIIILHGLLGTSAITIIEVKLYELSLVKFS